MSIRFTAHSQVVRFTEHAPLCLSYTEISVRSTMTLQVGGGIIL